MCLIHIKLQSIIRMTVDFHVLTVINATTMPQWKKQGGKINFSKVHHFWMCYCSFAIGHFLIFKNQSERQAFELLFKVQISPDHPSHDTNKSCVFLYIPPFVNFTVLSMEFPIRNWLPFFFQTDGNFYQIILSHSQGRGPNKSLIKKSKSHLR